MSVIVLSVEYGLISLGALVLFIVLFVKSVHIIRPHERGVVERFGRYNRTVRSGLVFILPFVERLIRVDMRETLIDVPPQEVITKDNVNIQVDAVIYFEVTDPFRVVYNVVMFEEAAIKLAQTNLRNVIGSMTLDETLASRERINNELRQILDEATAKWGVRITRVEIQKIEPPRDITEAMSRQMKAERTKRAAILEAEGIKRASILKAEGQKESEILEAEGRAVSIAKVAEAERLKRIKLAEGEAEGLLKIFKAVHEGKVDKEILTLKYLEALEKIADGRASKIFMPVETAGILSAISTLAEAYKAGKERIEEKKHERHEPEQKIPPKPELPPPSTKKVESNDYWVELLAEEIMGEEK